MTSETFTIGSCIAMEYMVSLRVFTRFSTADTCKNCAKCGKGFKIDTNEAYNIKIKIKLGGISKIFCLCSHANMAAPDKGISLKKKFLKKNQNQHLFDIFCEIQYAITQRGSPRSTCFMGHFESVSRALFSCGIYIVNKPRE